MAVHIQALSIEQFRGIRQLDVEQFNHVNLILGDNNCGKTSFLEALLLLRNPKDFSNVLRIARLRDSISTFSNSTVYDNFMTLFPHFEDSQSKKALSVKAICGENEVSYDLWGSLETVMLDEIAQSGMMGTNRRWNIPYIKRTSAPKEVQAFIGEMSYRVGQIHGTESVAFHEYALMPGRSISKDHFLNMVYLAPFDHLKGNLFSRILKDEAYKELCVHILQLFDPGISDLLLLKNEDTGRPIDCIRHKELGVMPLSTYGDGIKKVLSIASGIAQAVDGVLLIDEVETAIHSKYLEEIFRFLTMACIKFRVQLFITSHSMEAIDAFLAVEDYDTQSNYDEIGVITIKKDPKSLRSYSRVLPGRHVCQNREQFGFEVRL